MKPNLGVALTTALLLAACQREATAPTQPVATATSTQLPQAFTTQPWSLPATAAAAQPDLLVTPDGRLLLSWVEPQRKSHALKFATFANGQWSAPRPIAQGDDWFVNWADIPHVAVTEDGALWAHWLQKSAASTYAYDVVLVHSADGGSSWSKPVRVNDDGKAAEHGFVSLWPASRATLGIAWLDGRESGGEEQAGHHGHAAQASGAMTLRTATFDAQLQRRAETRLDAMTCDCCQTDVAMTARGPLLVYRDRTPEEIRDIAVTRQESGAWTPPHVVHDDHWKMPACPVNGPSVSARGNEVLVGWYTAANDVPMLKLARSNDAGDSFAAPVTLDQGEAVQGRVHVAFGTDAAWAVWLREDAQGQSLQLARYAPDLSSEVQRIEVARLQGRGRGTGFPKLALRNGVGYVVWTDIVDGKPKLMGATITR